MEGHYPKYVFNAAKESKLVASAAAHEALETKEPGVWAESPEHFDEAGKAIYVEDVVEESVVIPGVTAGTSPYPKWLYHPDGRAQVIQTKDAHDALIDRDDWQESPDLTAAQQANSVAKTEAAGQALWETPVRDVLEMLKGSSLQVLEKTHAMEEQNPNGARKTLLRELADLIVEAQAAENADPGTDD